MPQNVIELRLSEIVLHLPTTCLPDPQNAPALLWETAIRNSKQASSRVIAARETKTSLFLLKPFVAHKNLLLSFSTDILMFPFFCVF